MASLPLYVVDSFAHSPFSGNPAGVVLLEKPLPDEKMRLIAAEMRHAETAFVEPALSDPSVRKLRWFTPEVEVDLCGHATLATAAVLFGPGDFQGPELRFQTRSGELIVRRTKEAGYYDMDLPVHLPIKNYVGSDLLMALGLKKAFESYVSEKHFQVIVVSEDVDIRKLTPDFVALRKVKYEKGADGVIVTRKGPAPYDFTSRMFAPAIGIDEDPVTGSAHTVLAPLWAEKLGTRQFRAFQASMRGGELMIELRDTRVGVAGRAHIIVQGTIHF